jgi:hypothetical protein
MNSKSKCSPNLENSVSSSRKRLGEHSWKHFAHGRLA